MLTRDVSVGDRTTNVRIPRRASAFSDAYVVIIVLPSVIQAEVLLSFAYMSSLPDRLLRLLHGCVRHASSE
jgi:hypothetical protein